MKKIILASGSPRRREILENTGIDFSIFVSGADESVIDKNSVPVNVYVQELALLKANDTAAHVDDTGALVVAADTVVYSDGEIMGKPKDAEDAFNMLKNLSGRCHSVFTGICVLRRSDMHGACKSVETKVHFRNLSDETIRAYVKSGEPMDKAGAYGIQGLGALLVDKIEGDYFNVVGLPIAELAGVLKEDFDFDVFKGE